MSDSESSYRRAHTQHVHVERHIGYNASSSAGGRDNRNVAVTVQPALLSFVFLFFMALPTDNMGTGVWRQRVQHEQAAMLRASPIIGAQTARNNREARLRNEMNLLLSVAATNRIPGSSRFATPRHSEKAGSKRLEPRAHPSSHRSSSTSRRHKPEEPLPAPRMKPLTSPQVGMPVHEAGSLSSRMLQERGHVFKNMESAAW